VSDAVRDALVFGAAGATIGARAQRRLDLLHAPLVIAADGGAATALALGWRPDLVIGDLDSLAPETLAQAREQGIAVEPYARAKDLTDGQLAVDRAAGLVPPPARLWLVGFLGGPRLDHELANVLYLTRLARRVTLLDELDEASIVRPAQPFAWATAPREIVSLIPLTADVRGVSTLGLRWTLRGEPLELGSTRGISNEPVSDVARVVVDHGVVLLTRHFPP
jgi:thiamine pyrophosphokinase